MQPGEKRRILYGVHGYGRGHAARAQAVLPHLAARYDVRILAGDDAYDQLRGNWPVVRIPTLRYYHDERRRRSAWLTIRRNTPAALDLLLEGPIFQMVRDEIRRYRPDVVVSDSEGWTHRAARSLGIPRISFDHYGVLAHCRLEMPRWDRFVCELESWVYRRLVCRPERAIVAAFYDGEPRRGGVRTVGAILRREVRQARPTRGQHLLVYFSNAEVHFTPRVRQALQALDGPVKVYGLDREAVEGNLEFRPAGNLPFVRDLASCRAVFSTAGNQLISEAIHFGKPLLVLPEEALEQRLNARFVERWRIGMRTQPSQVSAELLRDFLDRADEFAANIPARRRDGLAETLDALDQAIDELAADTP
jgi:uncharacterized protein (TIGR00661 family)